MARRNLEQEERHGEKKNKRNEGGSQEMTSRYKLISTSDPVQTTAYLRAPGICAIRGLVVDSPLGLYRKTVCILQVENVES